MQAIDQLMYLKRCSDLVDVNFKHNPVSCGPNAGSYYEQILDSVPNLEILDDEEVMKDKIAFL